MKFLLATLLAFAADEAKPVNVNLVAHDQAKQFKGKRVQLILKSGKELEGTLGEVSAANIELKGLIGKEAFDAVVRVDDVAAYVYRVK